MCQTQSKKNACKNLNGSLGVIITIFIKKQPRNVSAMNEHLLGGKPTAQPVKTLETFDNPNPNRDFHIHMEVPEFTCLCPKTGQPDFAVIYLDYIPNKLCVELKSLKLYMWSFRDEGCSWMTWSAPLIRSLCVLPPSFMCAAASLPMSWQNIAPPVGSHSLM